jgi:hypothetical protein
MDGKQNIYRIAGFTQYFTTHELRQNRGPFKWIATPTKHYGLSYRRLLRMPNGEALFGAWNVILQTAAKCIPHGTLVSSNGVALTAADIADTTGFKAETIQACLDACASTEIGWIEVIDHVAAPTPRPEKVPKPTPAPVETPAAEAPAAETPAPEVVKDPEPQAPVAEAEEPKKKGKVVDPNPNYTEGFEKFWSSWPQTPRKKGRPQCFDKWQTQRLEPRADDIVRAVEAAKKTRDWLKDNGQFIPSPLPWLNQQAYEAFLASPAPKKVSTPATVLEPAQPAIMLNFTQRRQYNEYLADKQRFAVGAIKEPPTLPADHPFFAKEFGQMAGAA